MPLIKIILFIITIFLTNNSIANNNEIIFEINSQVYTSIDLKNRINYLENLNSVNLDSKKNNELIKDFFNIVIFYEYVKKNKFLD